MSAEMRDFAASFNKGLDRGVGIYEKSQQQAIEHERNKVLRDQHEAQERHNIRRDDLYAQSVTNAAETNRMKAQAALNKSNRGGGGPAAPPATDDLDKAFAGRGLTVDAPAPPPAPAPVNITVGGTGGDTAVPIAPPPLAAKGGMIRKYADGGMTVAEALSYGPKAAKDTDAAPATAAGTTGSNFSSAYQKSADAYTKAAQAKADAAKNPTPSITPTGPVGTGAGGSYTTQDVQPGGVLSGNTAIDPVYRRGGAVRRFASGGRVMEAAIDTGTSGPGSGYGYRAAPPSRGY